MADQNDLTTNVALYEEGKTDSITSTAEGSKECLDVNLQKDSTNPVNGLFISTFLRDSTDSSDMTILGSLGSPQSFYAGPAAGKIWYVSRMIIFMEDNSMSWQKFGGVSELTNGVAMSYDSHNVYHDLLDGETITTNSGFINFCYDGEIDSSSSDILRVRWTFSKSGTFLELDGDDGDQVSADVQDNLSGLAKYRTLIQGYEIDA